MEDVDTDGEELKPGCCSKVRELLKITKRELLSEPGYSVCLANSAASKLLTISVQQFGTFYVQFVYEQRG